MVIRYISYVIRVTLRDPVNRFNPNVVGTYDYNITWPFDDNIIVYGSRIVML